MMLPKRIEIDHSARFYPIIATKKAQSMFRVGATLADDVDKALLEVALNEVINRFPSYKVRLRKGYSWHYFERNEEHIKVFDLQDEVLHPVDESETNGYLFKVFAKDNVIVIEMFHAVTDAMGLIAFLKALISHYRHLQGVNIDANDGIIDVDAEPTLDEMQDGFAKHFNPQKMDLRSLAGKVPHRIRGTLSRDEFCIELADANTDDIVKNAKSIGVSFTSYIVGLIAKCIEDTTHPKNPIAIMVPINLRALYKCNTHRNFVAFIRVIIEPNTYHDISEYANEVALQLKEKSQKHHMDKFIATTVKAQKNVVMRIVPLFIKAFFIKLGRVFMKSRQTIIVSNLTMHNVPKELGVKRFMFSINVSKNNTQNIALVSTNNTTTVSMTRCIEENTLFEELLSALKLENIETNKVAVYPAK